MTKKQIQYLVEASYKTGELDEKKVDQVAALLDRRDLKAYVRALKLTEQKKTVSVALPTASVYNTTKQIFFDLFPGKTVSVAEDKLLMLGARVTADDMVYDFSLQKKLEDFLFDIEQSYDEE